MEASSKGYIENNGIESIGIICSPKFTWRENGGKTGNKYITKTIDSSSLLNRLELLLKSKMFLILPGSLGTLQEFISLLTEEYANNKEENDCCIVAFRKPWENVINSIKDDVKIPERVIKLINYIDNVDEMIKIFNNYKNNYKNTVV